MDIKDTQMREEVLLFGQKRSLVGVITDPPGSSGINGLPAVIFLNAGVIHRVGPNRLYVKMARKLAAAGYLGFRFDHSGIGDSIARNDNLPYEKSSINEVQEAMDLIGMKRGVQRFVLVGMCRGGVAAFRTACADQRVVGAVIVNALLENRDNISNEIAEFILKRKVACSYWQFKVFNLQSWLKFIRGNANYRNVVHTIVFQVKSLFSKKTKIQYEDNKVVKDLRLLVGNDVAILFIFGETTIVYEYFRATIAKEVHELSADGKIKLEVNKYADHNFTLLWSQEKIIEDVCGWIQSVRVTELKELEVQS